MAVTVTGVSGGTRSVCPGPATSAASRLDAVSSTATARDRAMYERPQRSPSTIAGIDSSRACTTVCGEPTGCCSVWESLPPTAATRRPSHSSRCQMRSDSSSSRFHRPFHTSSASTSAKPNSHADPGTGTAGWAATTKPPASRTSAAKRGNTPSRGAYRQSTQACGDRPTASQCPCLVVTSSPGITNSAPVRHAGPHPVGGVGVVVGGDDEVQPAGVRGRHQFTGIALAVGVNGVQMQVPAVPARTADRRGRVREHGAAFRDELPAFQGDVRLPGHPPWAQDHRTEGDGPYTRLDRACQIARSGIGVRRSQSRRGLRRTSRGTRPHYPSRGRPDQIHPDPTHFGLARPPRTGHARC